MKCYKNPQIDLNIIYPSLDICPFGKKYYLDVNGLCNFCRVLCGKQQITAWHDSTDAYKACGACQGHINEHIKVLNEKGYAYKVIDVQE